MFENLTVLAILQKGGIAVIVLGLFSLASIALILERIFAFRSFRLRLFEFSASLEKVVSCEGIKAGAVLSESSRSPLANVYLGGYAKRGRGKDEVLRAMELAGRAEISALEKYLGALGTIGSTAPFVGLFGTVLGIIRAFSDMAVTQGASPAAVADGIAEALIATAAGLFVAVPAVIAYNYFARAISKRALELEAAASEFVDPITTGHKDGVGS